MCECPVSSGTLYGNVFWHVNCRSNPPLSCLPLFLVIREEWGGGGRSACCLSCLVLHFIGFLVFLALLLACMHACVRACLPACVQIRCPTVALLLRVVLFRARLYCDSW